MSNEIYHISLVKNGRFSDTVRKDIAYELQRFEGKRIEITIKQVRGKRSLPQNSLIHVYFTLLKNSLNDLGNEFTMLEVKELMKHKFLTIDVVDKSTGEVLGTTIRKTSSLNKLECGEFIDNIIRWSAELGIVLPIRGNQLEID